jgi:hypothetical protein
MFPMMHNPKVPVKILLLLVAGILAAIFGGVLASGQQPANESLNVCDVLTNTHRYRHRVVEIRGELRVGRHGAGLVGEHCAAVKANRVPAICITAAGDVNAPEVPFRSNTTILDPVLAFQRTLGELDGQFHSLAVLEGQLFFEDERGGVGFCHVNAYPALMVVKDIKYYSLWRARTAATTQGARAGDSSTEMAPNGAKRQDSP